MELNIYKNGIWNALAANDRLYPLDINCWLYTTHFAVAVKIKDGKEVERTQKEE